MLKACCDCIFGSTTSDGNERGNGVPLTQMNGKTSPPQWQSPNTQLLTIAYQLQQEHTFAITGTMMDQPESLTISLETGGNNLDKNIICQVAAKFYENKLYVNNGKVRSEEHLDETMTAGDLLNGPNFNVSYECRTEYDLYVYTNNSMIKQLPLNDSVNFIRYINVDGYFHSVKTLSYNFGNGIKGDPNFTLPDWPRPKWPNPNSIVLLIPQMLKPGNGLTVTGSMVGNPNRLEISLVTDHRINQNVACQLQAMFDENTLHLNTNVNGEIQDVSNDKSSAANDILSGFDFNISFTCREGNGENFFDIYYNNNSYIDQVITGHNFYDIRYIVLDGDISEVKTLEFQL